MPANVVELLQRGTAGINNIELELKNLGAIGVSEQVPIEQFPIKIRGLVMAVLGCIAEEFDKTKQYNIGDYVIYNMELYKFTAVHVADTNWDTSNVQKVKVTDELGIKIRVNGNTSQFYN
jgi:hypothetical protein